MIVGNYYDKALTVTGGVPPYRWMGGDLPEGIKCRSWGAYFGVIKEPGDHSVPFQITDANSAVQRKNHPLSFKNMPDPPAGFCKVPGGDLQLGYHPLSGRDTRRGKWLNYLQTQGYPISEQIAKDQWPAEKIHVDGFYIQKYEVTNAEYSEFVNATGHSSPSHWGLGPIPDVQLQLPVVNITFDDAKAYCQWKTEQAKEMGDPYIFSIPSDLQWEKAAKGWIIPDTDPGLWNGPGRIYPWGDKWGDGMVHDMGKDPFPVRVSQYSLARSQCEACDLGGNVAEWIDGGIIKSGRILKYIRGASWRKKGQFFALTFLKGVELIEVGISNDDIGFRCVAKLVDGDAPTQELIPLGNDQYIDGRGQDQFIGKYSISRFAVSNEEFKEFKPEHMFNPSERGRPVTGVSHGSAVDFCLWKSAQLNMNCHLPSRFQWERACRGTGGRDYPWSSQYKPHLCNSLESGWGRTVDVWDLWQGATPDGIYNLCGNTFEWLVDGNAVGGSWCSTCESYGKPPYNSDASAHNAQGQPDIGFRYVVS